MPDIIEYKRHPVSHRRTAYWYSKDGPIAVRDLTDRHLIQIILYLYKNAERFHLDELGEAFKFYCSLHGEHAQYEAESIIDQLEDMNESDYIEEVLAPEIFYEAGRRHIDPYPIINPPLRIIFDD